jgi:hypothetical protein
MTETQSATTEKKTGTVARLVRTFAPERWGQVDKFAAFFASSFPDAKTIEHRAVLGVRSHFSKALVLRSLSLRITPTLAIDKQQLNEKGYSGMRTPGS